ncbi:hypothetical protein ABPG72_021220 [Tetrahymena utriculariae]
MKNKNQSTSNQNVPLQTQYQPLKSVQNYTYISQIGYNDNPDRIQQSHVVNMSQLDNPQQRIIDPNQSVLGICCVCCLTIVNNLFSIIFGVLFYVFQGDSEKYNHCSNEPLRQWSYTTSIVLFINCGIQILKALERAYLQQEKIANCLGFLVLISLITSIIGLTANISSDCGQLYLLAFIFCTFFYIVLGLLIIGFLVIIMLRTSR